MYNYPRHGHHLVHAESHLTQSVATMDNCFGISLCCSHICCVELTIKLGVLCTRLVSKGPMQHGFVRSSTDGYTCGRALIRATQLSTAATACMIWQCARLRYWPNQLSLTNLLLFVYFRIITGLNTSVQTIRIRVLFPCK